MTVMPQKSRCPKPFTAHSRPVFQSCNLGQKLAFSTRDSLSVLSRSFCLSNSTFQFRASSRRASVFALTIAPMPAGVERRLLILVISLGQTLSERSLLELLVLCHSNWGLIIGRGKTHHFTSKAMCCDRSRGGTFSR